MYLYLTLLFFKNKQITMKKPYDFLSFKNVVNCAANHRKDNAILECLQYYLMRLLW